MANRSTNQDPKYIKLWPLVAISSWWINAGGSYRAWRIAHNLDLAGSGKVEHGQLHNYLADHGVKYTTRRRWIRQAVELGLFKERECWTTGKMFYLLAGLGRAAAALSCEKVGKPISIKIRSLTGQGWKPFIWAAFNATLSGPMSQKVKEKLTGVDPRTQRRYLSKLPVKKKTNYAKRELKADPLYLEGYEAETGRKVFINEQGEVVQKLPDYIVVPGSVARKEPKGRSSKAQRLLNTALLTVEQGSSKKPMRLWHDDPKGLSATEKKTAQIPVEDLPDNLFLKDGTISRATFWQPVPLC